MKVWELINELSKYDGDKEVVYPDYGRWERVNFVSQHERAKLSFEEYKTVIILS